MTERQFNILIALALTCVIVWAIFVLLWAFTSGNQRTAEIFAEATARALGN